MHPSRISLFLLLFALAGLSQAQTFDERMDDWPVDLSIAGIVAGSDAETPTEQQKEFFLAESNGDDSIIVSVSFGDVEPQATTWKDAAHYFCFQVPMGQTSASLVACDSESDSECTLEQALASATGVWLSADSEIRDEHRKTLWEIRDQLHTLVDRGGVLFGGKGVCRVLGAIEIMQDQRTGNVRHASIASGLGLIPDVVIQTMYQQSDARPQLLGVLGSHPRLIGIGMDSGTTVILKGRKIRAMGSGKLHFLTMANERTPLRSKSIGQSNSRRINPYESLVDLTAWRRDAIDRTLEEFPSAKPEKPFVEKGTLLIVGGGGLPNGMMEQFIELAGGKQARLVYIPCTERAEINQRDQGLIEVWKKAGVASADVVHTKDRNRANNDEAFLEPLRNATGIFFGGGRQWNFSDSYYGTKAHRMMKEVLNRGGVVAGSSAGASIQARYLARANPLGNFDIMAPGYERGGLGFIGGVAIDQHFTQRNRQPDMSSLVNRYPQLLGIGIDERTAIVVRKSIAEVVGDGAVYLYDRNQQSAHDDPDYLKLEAGSRYDLAKRELVLE